MMPFAKATDHLKLDSLPLGKQTAMNLSFIAPHRQSLAMEASVTGGDVG